MESLRLPLEPAAGARSATSPSAPSRGGLSGAVSPAPGMMSREGVGTGRLRVEGALRAGLAD